MKKPIPEKDAFMLNPQSLAFVGDAVYSLYIRSEVISHSTAKSGSLHKQSVLRVRATAQSEALDKLEGKLNDREQDLVRRARNTKVNAPSKKASLADYMKSTAYEALLGYLFVTGQKERLSEILVNSEGS